MNFLSALRPAYRRSRFIDPGYYVWCGTVSCDMSSRFHLLYSRWPHRHGFDAWVTHSEIAHAVADNPLGPFIPIGTALPVRGNQYWDGLCTHNPTLLSTKGRHYLYYTGNTVDEATTSRTFWTHRNHQRIGVAVADSPTGPWTRPDQPIIDLAIDSSAPDCLMTSNPTATIMTDGRCLLIYKGVGLQRPLPFGGPVVHLAATADSPAGPFVKNPTSIFTVPGVDFPAEDPFIWRQEGTYWAIVKDFGGHFTGAGPSLALFCSENGLDWKPAEQPLASRLEIQWEDGVLEKVKRLERPQLWIEGGVPKVLYCAVMAQDGECFNVAIPLEF